MFQVAILEKHAIPRNPTLKLQIDPDDTYQHCSQIFQQARNRKCLIHVLHDTENNWYGFIALRFWVLTMKPCLVIDYVFTSRQYRGMQYEDLGGLKVFEFLMAYALSKAADINGTVPVRYVALQPGDGLETLYIQNGFSWLDDEDWMFMKIPMAIPIGVPA